MTIDPGGSDHGGSQSGERIVSAGAPGSDEPSVHDDDELATALQAQYPSAGTADPREPAATEALADPSAIHDALMDEWDDDADDATEDGPEPTFSSWVAADDEPDPDEPPPLPSFAIAAAPEGAETTEATDATEVEPEESAAPDDEAGPDETAEEDPAVTAAPVAAVIPTAVLATSLGAAPVEAEPAPVAATEQIAPPVDAEQPAPPASPAPDPDGIVDEVAVPFDSLLAPVPIAEAAATRPTARVMTESTGLGRWVAVLIVGVVLGAALAGGLWLLGFGTVVAGAVAVVAIVLACLPLIIAAANRRRVRGRQ